MTSTGNDPQGGPRDPQRWPAGPAGPADPVAAPARPGTVPPAVEPTEGRRQRAGATPERATSARRRPPVWVLVVAAVVVVGLVVVGVRLLGGQGGTEEQPVPEAEVVTLPAPTPTVAPIAVEGGTAFASALPTTVLAHALSEAGEHVPLLAAGALEGYRYVYTDGAVPVVLVTGQWETPEVASAVYAGMVQSQVAAAGETEVEEGAVTTADGTETGRYTLVPRGDDTATLTWWNGTAVLQLDGPAEELPDLFAAFPL